jgi:DNA-binding GntR family transcriptional regulator
MSSLIRTEPLYDQIYDILWQRILALEIPAGTRLRDIEWAEKLDVSRTPVREALRKLQKDGVLEPAGHGRYTLKRIDAEDLRSLYRCRAVLEALALRDLKPHIRPDDIARLEAIVEKTDISLAASDFRTAYQLNTEFHGEIVALSHNPHLQMLLATLRRLILYARSTLRAMIEGDDALSAMYSEHLQRSQEHHRTILAAIAARDIDKAAVQMERHLFETAEHMAVILSKAIAYTEDTKLAAPRAS